MTELLIAIVCLILGHFLTIFWQKLEKKKDREEKLKQINAELESNYHEIHQKKDHLKKIIANLNKNKILPGTSVEFVDVYYTNYHKELIPHISTLEKNSLHVIYNRLKIVDKKMDSFEEDILKFLSLKTYENYEKIFSMFINRMNDLLFILESNEKLIKEHLAKKPRDVFFIQESTKPSEMI